MSFHTVTVAITAGLLAAAASFFLNAGAENRPEIESAGKLDSAIFAGGCFWCVESDFDKLDGVIETISGYTGGNGNNPTYKTHSEQGHLEVVKVIYDPASVDYAELVDYFFRHIDPTDDGGQFCDRGNSYRTAVFVENAEERAVAQDLIQAYQDRGIVAGDIVTRILDETPFHIAEKYHQDFYIKNPTRYNFYREGCGRDKRIAQIWRGPNS